MKNKKSEFNLKGIDIDYFESGEEIEEIEVDADVKNAVQVFLELDYPINLSKDEDEVGKYWVAEHPDLPGCKSHGSSKEEAMKNLEEAKTSWMYSFADLGKEIPMPNQAQELDNFSGKILLRIPKELHYKLTIKAKSDGTSLNQEILYLLSSALGEANTTSYLELINEKLDKLQHEWKRETSVNKKFYGESMESLNNIFFSDVKAHKAKETTIVQMINETYTKIDRSKTKADYYYKELESSFFQ